MADSDGRTAGSIFIRVRPDTKGFRKETQDKIGRKPLEAEMEVEADTSKVDKAMDDLEKDSKKKKLQVSYEVSKASLNRAKNLIGNAIKGLGLRNMEVSVDEKSVKEASDKIKSGIGADKPQSIEIEYTDDQEGIRHIINTLEGVKRAAREIHVGEWQTDQASLDEALAKLNAQIEVPLKIDPEDTSSLDAALAEIERRLADLRAIEVPVQLNKEALEDMKATLSYEKELLAEPITIDLTYNTDDAGSLDSAIAQIDSQLAAIDALSMSVELNESSLLAARAELEEFRDQIEEDDIELEINVSDPSSMRAALARLSGELATLDSAKVSVSPDRSSIVATIAEINAALGQRFQAQVAVAGTGFAATEAQLQTLSRDRVVELKTKITGRAARLFEGGFRSLAGVNDVEEMVRAFENLITNFDVISSQAAVMGTAIGTAVNVGTFALGGMLTVLGDASRVVGLLAAAPTALLAAGAVMQTHTAIWNDFGAALMGIPGVLESLPPNAQQAVKSIEALNEATNKAVQDGFWRTMNDEISRFADEVAPTLTKGMERTAQVYGDTLSGMLDLTTAWVRNGDLGAAFANINSGLAYMGEAAVTAYDAIMTLGLRGSSMFPRLGFEVNNLATQFNNWIQAAAAAGDIERWIQDGIQALSLMTQAGGAAVSMLQSLTASFRQAGMGGLQEFTEGLQRAAEIMESPVWQTKMSNIFEGATQGARETFEGFAAIAEVVYDLDEETGALLLTIGEVAREFQFLVADLMARPVFTAGIQDFFEGIRDSLMQLRPAAESLGDIFGTLGSLAGEILREMAPGVNTLLGIFSDAANSLRENLIEAVHPLTTFIDNLGHATRILVGQLLPAVNGILEAFNALPPFLQNMIALLVVTSGYMRAIGTAATAAFASNRFTTAGAGLLYMRDAARQTGTAVRNLGTYVSAVSFMGLQRAGSTAMVGLSTQADNASRRMRTAFTGAFTAIGTAARGFGGLLLGALGGPVGIALMAIVTGATMIASKFGEAKAEAEEFKNQVREARDLLAEGDRETLWDNTFNELEESLGNIVKVGGDANGVIDKIISGNNMSGMIADWQALEEAADRYRASLTSGNGMFELAPEEQAAIERTGVSWGELTKASDGYFGNIASDVQGQVDVMGKAETSLREMLKLQNDADEGAARTGQQARDAYATLGEEFHTASDGAQSFADSVKTIGDSSATAESRVTALRSVLQTLGGDMAEPAQTAIAAWDSMTAAMSTAESISNTAGQTIKGDADGIATDYESMSERQKLAIQGVSQIHDSAMAQAIEAYDREIKASGDRYKAVEAGKSAYQSVNGELEKFIDASGASAAEADVLRAELEGIQDIGDLEIALQLNNLSENELEYAYDGLTKIKQAGLDIDESEWMAFIAANPDQAYLAIENMDVALNNFEASEYIADLSVNDQQVVEKTAEAMGMGDEWENGDYGAVLTAMVEDEGIDAALEKMMKWENSDGEAVFSTRDEATAFIDRAQELADGYEGTYSADFVAAGLSDLNTSVADLNRTLQEIGEQALDVKFSKSGDEEVKEASRSILEDLDLLDNKNATAEVDIYDFATEKIVPLNERVDDLGQANPNINLDATDRATPKIDPLAGTLGSITATPWNTEINATDNASTPAQNAKGNIEAVPRSRNSTLSANGNVTSFAQTAVDTISNVNGKGVLLTAAGNAISFASTAIEKIGGVRSKGVVLSAVGNAIEFASTAISTIGRFIGKTVSVNTIGNAISNLQTVVGLLGRVVSKTVSVRVNRIVDTVKDFFSADGNLFGSVGSSGPRQVKRFANGGVEQHNAQIAYSTSSTPVRVWAEPETGGEAYIPLSASKRARSTAIWRETGRRLGVYEDGGIEGKADPAKAGVVMYQTVNYPVAESTTKASKRGLDMVGIRV